MNTPREIVYQTLDFKKPARVPRDMWVLPWAEIHHKKELESILDKYPMDIVKAPACLREEAETQGDAYVKGTFIDEWGCIFENYADGIIGEVKQPLIKGDEGWKDRSRIRIPRAWLSLDKERINRFCHETDKFVLAGACPRPFERLQFIRGTEELFMDLLLEPEGLSDFIQEMHEFYCELLTKWAETDVDALKIMDDWGSQLSLLINPELWVRIFKPLYKDYIEIAHSHGKRIFMHSDGHILSIIPHLIELGLDAVNSQIFCMGAENMVSFRNKITFWGEIDRQHILPNGTEEDVKKAVASIRSNLWGDGGCIAQCEFGPGANPDNVESVYRSWAQY